MCHQRDFDFLRDLGAVENSKGQWTIDRSKLSFQKLEVLAHRLPRAAQLYVEPTVIDLIPASSWGASLANMLVPASWKKIRDQVCALAGGCTECGYTDRLECHEIWSYNSINGIQKLEGFMSLCSLCHETQHLGLAAVRNRGEGAVQRLKSINRLRDNEVGKFVEDIFSRFEDRSKIAWTLDISLIAKADARLKRMFYLVDQNMVECEIDGSKIRTRLAGVNLDDSYSSIRIN